MNIWGTNVVPSRQRYWEKRKIVSWRLINNLSLVKEAKEFDWKFNIVSIHNVKLKNKPSNINFSFLSDWNFFSKESAEITFKPIFLIESCHGNGPKNYDKGQIESSTFANEDIFRLKRVTGKSFLSIASQLSREPVRSSFNFAFISVLSKKKGTWMNVNNPRFCFFHSESQRKLIKIPINQISLAALLHEFFTALVSHKLNFILRLTRSTEAERKWLNPRLRLEQVLSRWLDDGTRNGNFPSLFVQQ